MTTQETSELGSRPEYMRKLLQIVSTFTEVRQLDITLRFTLSALWNLTDESPTTCRVFLEQKGMELFQVKLVKYAVFFARSTSGFVRRCSKERGTFVKRDRNLK